MLMQVGHLKDRLEEHLKFRESSSATDLSAAASDGGLVAITRALRAVANDAESCTRCSSAAVAERLLEAAANLHTVSSAAVASGMTPRSARSELDLLRCESEENINGGGGRIGSTVVYGSYFSFLRLRKFGIPIHSVQKVSPFCLSVSAGLPSSNPSTDNVVAVTSNGRSPSENASARERCEASKISTELQEATEKLAKCEKETESLKNECRNLRARLDETQQVLREKVQTSLQRITSLEVPSTQSPVNIHDAFPIGEVGDQTLGSRRLSSKAARHFWQEDTQRFSG